MSLRRRWSPEEIALLVADYAAFVPVPEIAAKLGRGVATTEMRIQIHKLRRTRGVIQALKWAPDHLKARLGHVPNNEWLRLCHEWRGARAKAVRDERQARLAAGCREIDGRSTTRNEKIAAKRALGMTLEEIARQHGITRERVRQVMWRHAHPQKIHWWLNRLVAIWDVCPSDDRAAFLAKIGVPPDAGG